jgi:hypothetical protein
MGNTVITDVSLDHLAQPLTHFRDGVVHATLEFSFHLAQLGLQPLTYRLPEHRIPSVSCRLTADVREAERVERLGLPLTRGRLAKWNIKYVELSRCAAALGSSARYTACSRSLSNRPGLVRRFSIQRWRFLANAGVRSLISIGWPHLNRKEFHHDRITRPTPCRVEQPLVRFRV